MVRRLPRRHVEWLGDTVRAVLKSHHDRCAPLHTAPCGEMTKSTLGRSQIQCSRSLAITDIANRRSYVQNIRGKNNSPSGVLSTHTHTHKQKESGRVCEGNKCKV